jgi:hypothetical protein
MIKRIIVAAIAASCVAPFAFGQMKYSRPRPSPTPTATPAQVQSPIPAQRTMYGPRTTATPQQKPAMTPQTQARPSPVGQQRTAQMQNRSVIQPQRTMAPVPRAGAAPIQPRAMATPAPTPVKPTPTPVPPPDVRVYLDHQIANSKDQKFHMNVNGKDLPLTPFHVWPQRITGFNATSTSISMRSDEGRVYDIEFLTTGAQVTSVRIQRVNGE